MVSQYEHLHWCCSHPDPDIPCSRTMLMPQDGEAMQEATAMGCFDVPRLLGAPAAGLSGAAEGASHRGLKKIGASGQSHLHGLLV